MATLSNTQLLPSAKQKRRAATSQHINWGRWVLVAVLVVLSAAVILPIFIVVSQSFVTTPDLYADPTRLLPAEPTTLNWRELFNRDDLRLPRWFGNSLWVAIASTALTLALCSMAAYAFARLRFPGRNVLFFLMLFMVMLPSQVTFIPNYLLLRDWDMLNTHQALILPGIANAFGVFLLRQFFMSIPAELEEAAVLDGATRFGVFWRVILPLSSSALAALGVLVFVNTWNEFFWATIATSDVNMRTLPVGLSILAGAFGQTDRGLVLAGAALATIPTLVVYAIFQRGIVNGITMTGMGGR